MMKSQKRSLLKILSAVIAIVFFICTAMHVYILREQNSQTIVQKLQNKIYIRTNPMLIRWSIP